MSELDQIEWPIYSAADYELKMQQLAMEEEHGRQQYVWRAKAALKKLAKFSCSNGLPLRTPDSWYRAIYTDVFSELPVNLKIENMGPGFLGHVIAWAANTKNFNKFHDSVLRVNSYYVHISTKDLVK